MEAELTELETKINQLVALQGADRAQLLKLQQRIQALEAEKAALQEKLAFAIDKVELALSKLPEE